MRENRILDAYAIATHLVDVHVARDCLASDLARAGDQVEGSCWVAAVAMPKGSDRTVDEKRAATQVAPDLLVELRQTENAKSYSQARPGSVSGRSQQ